MAKTDIETLRFKYDEGVDRLKEAGLFERNVAHIKSGGIYWLYDIVFQEATLELQVQYGDTFEPFSFTRPLEEFLRRFRPATEAELEADLKKREDF